MTFRELDPPQPRRIDLRLLVLAAAVFAIVVLTSPVAAASDAARLAQLADDYFEQRLRFNSLGATEEVGDPRFEAELAIDIAPEHRAEQAASYRRFLQQLAALRVDSLKPADRLTHEVMKYDLSIRLEALSYPRHLMPVHQLEMVPVKLAGWAGGQSVQPFRTVRNYENYLKRIERLPLWNAQAISNMREGVRRGIVQSRPLVERTLEQLKNLAESTVEESPYYSPIKRMPADFPAADRARLTAAWHQALSERILPSQRHLYAYVRDQYLPHARKSAGLGALPGGAAWYRFNVRESTTTDLGADQIHRSGLQEVARIHGEMAAVQTKAGFSGPLSDFLRAIETRADLLPFRSEEEVLGQFRAIDVRIQPRLSQLFGRMPKAPLEIRPVDRLIRDSASSHYILPALDGSRPGVFYAAIHDPLKYSTPGMAALLLHEGQPGHHFHLALQQELDIPRFRRFLWYDAFGEGWALYAESLGREMGFYDDPYNYLGRLQMELLRAVRLVVDTGLHARGWTREQAIRYIMENQGVAEDNARRATERYMAWPGQALSYKTGEMRLLELRARARRELGDKFDLRAFHDELLGNGSLPLSMLDKRIDSWIVRQKRMLSQLARQQPAMTQATIRHPG